MVRGQYPRPARQRLSSAAPTRGCSPPPAPETGRLGPREMELPAQALKVSPHLPDLGSHLETGRRDSLPIPGWDGGQAACALGVSTQRLPPGPQLPAGPVPVQTSPGSPPPLHLPKEPLVNPEAWLGALPGKLAPLGPQPPALNTKVGHPMWVPVPRPLRQQDTSFIRNPGPQARGPSPPPASSHPGRDRAL